MSNRFRKKNYTVVFLPHRDLLIDVLKTEIGVTGYTRNIPN
jgi:hypothetical protein